MDLRTAVLSLTGAGAVVNARRPLDEWSRAQDEVSALLDRLDHGATAPPSTGRATSSAA